MCLNQRLMAFCLQWQCVHWLMTGAALSLLICVTNLFAHLESLERIWHRMKWNQPRGILPTCSDHVRRQPRERACSLDVSAGGRCCKPRLLLITRLVQHLHRVNQSLPSLPRRCFFRSCRCRLFPSDFGFAVTVFPGEGCMTTWLP